MKAAFYETLGPAREVLRVGELADPDPGPGEVRVRIHASGVNPSDVKARSGLRSRTMPFARVTPHSDGAGVIDRVGAGVDPARIGERVWLWNAAWGRPGGTAAQYVALPSRQAVRLADKVGFEAGACFGIPALTALHAVQGWGGVAGQAVLVQGGAGAVGHYALQFARRLGAATLLATVSSEEKAGIARAAGADVAIDYRREDLAARVREITGGRGLDRIIEVDLAANGALDAELLAPHGALVAYGSGAAQVALPFLPLIVKNLSLHAFIVYHLADADRARCEALLARALEDDAIEHRIEAVLPLERIAEAHEWVESGRALGNVIVVPD